MKERGLWEPGFWRGEGLRVLPKLSDHTAAFWPGRAKAELPYGAPRSAETLCRFFPPTCCQTSGDPDEGRGRKDQKTPGNILNHE